MYWHPVHVLRFILHTAIRNEGFILFRSRFIDSPMIVSVFWLIAIPLKYLWISSRETAASFSAWEGSVSSDFSLIVCLFLICVIFTRLTKPELTCSNLVNQQRSADLKVIYISRVLPNKNLAVRISLINKGWRKLEINNKSK